MQDSIVSKLASSTVVDSENVRLLISWKSLKRQRQLDSKNSFEVKDMKYRL